MAPDALISTIAFGQAIIIGLPIMILRTMIGPKIDPEDEDTHLQ